MAEIKHRIGIRATAAEVYQRLTTDQGLSSWWTEDTHGAGQPGSIIEFRFGGGGPDFEVIELIAQQLHLANDRAAFRPHARGLDGDGDLFRTLRR